MLKTVMKYAVNYDKILEFAYEEDDFVTKKVIDYYKDYVLNEKESSRKIRSLDNLVYLYTYDVDFRDYVKKHVNDFSTKEYGIDYYYEMDKILSKLYKNYMFYRKELTVKTKWL